MRLAEQGFDVIASVEIYARMQTLEREPRRKGSAFESKKERRLCKLWIRARARSGAGRSLDLKWIHRKPVCADESGWGIQNEPPV
jgi:hypothetical protein